MYYGEQSTEKRGTDLVVVIEKKDMLKEYMIYHCFFCRRLAITLSALVYKKEEM
jgi:hypothetical protein